MIKISVLYANRYKSHHDMFPLRLYKKKLSYLNIKVLFFNYLNKDTLSSDVIIISSYRANECFNNFAKKNNIDISNNNYLPIIELIKSLGISIIWFDTSDTTGISFPNFLDNVNVYLKQQILKKTTDTDNLYYDYFYRKYFHNYWKTERDKLQVDCKQIKKAYSKVTLGWNMAFSDWKIHGKNRIVRSFNIIVPSVKNNIKFYRKPLIERQKRTWFLGENKDHIINDYHRELLTKVIRQYNKKQKFTNYEYKSISYKKYNELLKETAVVPSPFGLGEICYRDFEILFSGCVMIKPNMNHLKTWPNIYRPMETYIPCKWDFSDLEEKINWVFKNISKAQEIASSGQKLVADVLQKENNFTHRFKNIIESALQC